ncbi:MAG TPA: chemotaxis protein CheW [Thermosulfurimonas dismutans]|uniref:Chemotaxis protein CheW n=1 Tax=Thermosulfurimonas dismutans TaxID=999894 RepID=A0A7C3GSR5_9BACT|nr:chemotaxis protein CheW [Thermosulfurimonas dismutans]
MGVYLSFWKGEHYFALEIETVEGVSRAERILPARWGPEWLVGFSFFRGQTVPVVDLERYLGGTSSAGVRYLVVSTGEEPVGFGASRLGARYEVEDPVEPVEDMPPGIKGQLLLGGRTALLVDPHLILKGG